RVAADSSGTGLTGITTTGVTWSGGAASFDGVSGAITASGPAVDTTKSYTASAWVKLTTTPSGWLTAVSQDAVHNRGLELQYDPADNRWAFARATSDTINAPVVRALSSTPPTVGAWTHLVGVFNSTNGAMTLYVNGTVNGTATDTTPYAATGPVQIGV